MPIQACKIDGGPGFRWGKKGTCYGYTAGDKAAKNAAKKKAIKQAIAAGAKPSEYADAGLSADEVAALADELATEDLLRVPILKAGGPYHGRGSPPEGDFFDRDYLAEVVAANVELADEVRPPNKIGHSKEQKLLVNSGLADDELPAAGWLTNFELGDDDDGVATIYADVKKVPKKLAALLRVGAFRTRSVELSKITRQKGDAKGKVYDSVVTALSWLGAKAPAVRTLDDIIALYAGTSEPQAATLLLADAGAPTSVYAGDGIDAEVIRFVDLSAGDIVWNPDDGCQDLMNDVRAALNPGPASSNYWVMDVSRDATRAIVSDYNSNETWVVPFTLDAATGEVSISPSSDWVLAEQAWVESAAEYANAIRAAGETRQNSGRSPQDDTTVAMPDKLKDLNVDQVKALAETLGVEVVEDEAKLRDAVASKLAEVNPSETGGSGSGDGGTGDGGGAEPTPGAPNPDEGTKPEPERGLSAEVKAELAVRDAKISAFEADLKKRREAARDDAIKTAISEGRLSPDKTDFWRNFFEEDEERATTMLAELPVNPELVRVYGTDDDGLDPETAAEAGDRAYADLNRAMGFDDLVPAERTAA